MAELDFGAFLEESLVLLWRERSATHAHVAEALGGRSVQVDVDGSSRSVLADGGRVRALRQHDGPGVRVATSRRAVLALVDGEQSLLSAARSGALDVRGASSSLAAFDAALRAYVAGAVRCPGFPMLLERYRAGEPR